MHPVLSILIGQTTVSNWQFWSNEVLYYKWKTLEIKSIFSQNMFCLKSYFLQIFSKVFSIKRYMGSIEEKGGLCYAIGMIFDN
jgi:hypothetical protein